MTTVHERVAALFATRLNLVVPSTDADLFETGALDSLGFVELLVQLEAEFGVPTSLKDMELDTFRSVASIADFILAHAEPDHR
jgi:D-alanine--poly(phosphoribitol) ligase subunit 2